MVGVERDQFFKTIGQLRKSGHRDEVLGLMALAFREETFSVEDFDRAGRLLIKEFQSSPGGCTTVRVLGQCTTSWLLPALASHAFGRGMRLNVSEGEFDNVLQEVVALQAPPDVLVLVPWNRRLLQSKDVDAEIEFWKQVWTLADQRGARRVVQVGYDYVVAGPLGHQLSGAIGDVELVRRTNRELRGTLPRDVFFVDLEQISGDVGRATFYEPRQYHWTKQPFSPAGVTQLASHITAAIRALTTGPKKVLAVDLDNTLWGGVVGELGPFGVELGESPEGEAYRLFQTYLKALADRGIVLAVVSKNNPDDVEEVFNKNGDMILRKDDFAAFEVGWGPKSEALKRIASTLKLGLDSFVFFDDEPSERAHVRQLLPTVEVVDVPKDPAEYVRALERGLWFEATALTAEDAHRAQEYAAERRRTDVKAAFESVDDYLASLSMKARVQPIGEADLQRVAQLIGKTNQFNLTTRRHTAGDVQALLSSEQNFGLSLRLRDQFGDYGLVAVLLGVAQADEETPTVRFDTVLMSCRVIGRTVEQFFVRTAIHEAQRRGARRVLGEYLPTAKNAVVASLYDDLGFDRRSTGASGHVVYALDIPSITEERFRTHVRADD